MRREGCRNRLLQGFTTAELLVGALVVLILFIAASPFYRAAREEAARVRCMAARRLIADAQEQYRARSPRHTYAPDISLLADILPQPPRCPGGGSFRCRLSTEEQLIAIDARHPGGRLVILCSEESHRPYLSPASRP